MGQRAAKNIILTGFSYTGKTFVGREVARRLGWVLVDTDDEIVLVAGKAIPDIFARDGEERFRQLERQVLAEACRRDKVVIATGGGAVLDATNRKLMRQSGLVICLEATPNTIYQRLVKDSENATTTVVRPLLAAPDPKERISWLKGVRQPYYDLADWKIDTTNLTVAEVCDQVLQVWRTGRRQGRDTHSLPTIRESEAPYCQTRGAALVVTTATESYPVFIGWGMLSELGKRMRNAGLRGQANIMSDDQVFATYGPQVEGVLIEAGFEVGSFVVPQGEKSKSLDTATRIYDFLVERHTERGDPIVALGGGMIGDLAGFVAATFYRGLPLVQVPTSLVAMVDSSIGGKVAVDHPKAKNLIGAFYQPRLVLADLEALATLPQRELVSGWTEVIKHAITLDPGLVQLLEAQYKGLLKLKKRVTREVVVRSAAIKADVVGQDEKETGRRIILNYGHTIGHGLEAATGYGRFLHGEAVAIGMTGSALLSHRLGLLSTEAVARQKALVEKFGLPTTCSGIDLSDLLAAMELDKKVQKRAVRWVLLSDIGQVVVRDDVPIDIVLSVIEELLG